MFGKTTTEKRKSVFAVTRYPITKSSCKPSSGANGVPTLTTLNKGNTCLHGTKKVFDKKHAPVNINIAQPAVPNTWLADKVFFWRNCMASTLYIRYPLHLGQNDVKHFQQQYSKDERRAKSSFGQLNLEFDLQDHMTHSQKVPQWKHQPKTIKTT